MDTGIMQPCYRTSFRAFEASLRFTHELRAARVFVTLGTTIPMTKLRATIATLCALLFAVATAYSPLPHIIIETVDATPITPDGNKKTIVPGTVTVVEDGEITLHQPMDIRGRGNSTWMQGIIHGKKPFRLKLAEERSLLGLAPAKNWVLLANIMDSSLMANAIAFEVAHYLELPFTHTMIPVDVTVNGEYVGNYMLTEHKEVREGRIDIGENGALFEMDSHFDQPPFQFEDSAFGLPIMLQYPKLEKWDDEYAARSEFLDYQQDLQQVLDLIAAPDFPDNGYHEVFDTEAFAKYIFVFLLTANQELNFPKSVYVYRLTGEEMYRMGPVWDFDWTFGYNEWHRKHYVNPAEPLFWERRNPGAQFFIRVLQDPMVQEQLSDVWLDFREHHFEHLLAFTHEYAYRIAPSYERDYAVWGSIPLQANRTPTLVPDELGRIITWLEAWALYLDEVLLGDEFPEAF